MDPIYENNKEQNELLIENKIDENIHEDKFQNINLNQNKATEQNNNPEPLPEILQNVVSNIHNQEQYAQNLLQDRFNNVNIAYYKSREYKEDLEDITNYTRKIGTNKHLTYVQRVTKESKLFGVQMSRLARDKKFGFTGDNKEMKTMKQNVNLLQGMLNSDLKPYMVDGKLNADMFMKVLGTAFDNAVKACDTYLETHRNPKSPWGKRRRRKASEMKATLEKQHTDYKNLVGAITAGAFKVKLDELNSPKEMLEKQSVVKIVSRKFMREGNSQDVYLATVEMEDQDGNVSQKKYYIKENLPLLHKDIDGFLSRRMSQLTQSEKNRDEVARKKSANEPINEEELEKLEELRMEKGKADNIDYSNGKRLIKLLQDKISKAPVNEKDNMREHCAGYFKYDFDMMFMELARHNQAVDMIHKPDMNFDLDHWQNLADKGDASAKIVLNILKDMKKNNDAFVLPQKVTASDWMKKKLNLDDKQDADLIALLEEIDKQEVNKDMQHENAPEFGRLEALFRITMGKEVELYGQMMQGGKLEESEMSQYNTMVTSYLGEHYGFSKEVVNTYIKVSSFDRWDGQTTNGTITMQEIAEGDEWIEVLKNAKKDGVKVQHTPDSVRQMLRLQMFDTVCQQKDRHGRNFKCKMGEEKDGFIPLLSTQAYDHDQSLAPLDLKSAFEEKYEKNDEGKEELVSCKKNRFLPSTYTVVKKNSPMYNYIAKKYFKIGAKKNNWMANMSEPLIANAKSNGDLEYKEMTPFVKSNVIYCVYGTKYYKAPHSRFGMKHPVNKQVCPGASYLLEDDLSSSTYNDPKLRDREKEKDWSYIKPAYGCDEKEDALSELYDIIRVLQDFYITDKPNQEEIDKIKDELNSANGQAWVAEMAFRKPEELDRKKLPKVAKAIKRLREINQKFDFSRIGISCNKLYDNMNNNKENLGGYVPKLNSKNDTKVDGVLQAWIDLTLYSFAKTFGQDPDVIDILLEEEGPKEFEELKNSNGDLVIPSMLHADREAYEQLKNMVRDIENGTLPQELERQHLKPAAIEGFVNRAKENIKRLEDMKEKAEKFLKFMYPEETEDNKKKRKFFLDKDDYKLFDDLSEFAVDPGNSYLVQDNEQFLACQEEYSQFMSEQDKKAVKEQRTKVLSDKKRWNQPDMDPMSTQVDMKINKSVA